MPDWILGLLGCSVLLAIPVAILIVLVRLRSRIASLEQTVGEQAERLAALEQPADASKPGPPAVSESGPEPIPEPEPEPDLEQVAEIAPPVIATTEPALPDAAATTDAEPEPATASPDDAEERGWGGVEEALWTRLPVWIGAAAMVLAGAYLVKLSFDRGWIGPPVRVGLGFAFGGAMLALGEWLRRSSAFVAQGLSAAGVATLYVASYAAVELYHLVPAAVGFALMVATTAVAVGLSLRQGYVVAVIGMVGGFLTPSLVSTDSPSPAVLFVYLALLQVGLLVVVRRRQWTSLGLVTALAGLLWALAVIGRLDGEGALWVGLFLVTSMASFLAGWILDPRHTGDPVGLGASAIGWLVGGGCLVASGVLAVEMDHGVLEWTFVGLLAAGCLLAARLDERHADRLHGLAWLAALVLVAFLTSWLGDVGPGDAFRVFATLATFGALLATGAYAAHIGSSRPGSWASLAAASAVGFVLLARAAAPRVGIADDDFPGGGLALTTALVVAAAGWPVFRRRASDPDAARPLAALAAGATSLVSLAVPMELDRQWLTVAWALEIPALIWLARRLEVGALRVMAAVLGVAVGVRLVINPHVVEYAFGTTPLWNGLLWVYGVPLAAVTAAAVIDSRRGLGRLGEGLRVLAVAVATVFLALEVRHLAQGGDLAIDEVSLVEWGGWVIAWLGLAWLVTEIAGRVAERGAWLDHASRGLSLLAFGAALAGPVLGANPLWADEPVGTLPIWNRLLLVYALPIPLLLVVARSRRAVGAAFDRLLARVAQVGALVAAFLLVTLQVRQFFHGDLLHVGDVSTAEQASYSIAWIVLGGLLAVGGVVFGGRLLRFGSLAVLLPAVLKVFLVDTSGLDGLWRVASLLGLGVSLFALAWIYQRFVFRRS